MAEEPTAASHSASESGRRSKMAGADPPTSTMDMMSVETVSRNEGTPAPTRLKSGQSPT